MARLKSLRLSSQKSHGSGGTTRGGTVSKKAVGYNKGSLGYGRALGRGIAGMTAANSGNLRKGAYGP